MFQVSALTGEALSAGGLRGLVVLDPGPLCRHSVGVGRVVLRVGSGTAVTLLVQRLLLLLLLLLLVGLLPLEPVCEG